MTRLMDVAIAMAENMPGEGWRVRGPDVPGSPILGNGARGWRYTITAEEAGRVRGVAFGKHGRWWVVDDGRGFVEMGRATGPTALVKKVWPWVAELLPPPDGALISALAKKRRDDMPQPTRRGGMVCLGPVTATLDPDPITGERFPYIEAPTAEGSITLRVRRLDTVTKMAQGVASTMVALYGQPSTASLPQDGTAARERYGYGYVSGEPPAPVLAAAKGRSAPVDDWSRRLRVHIEGESAPARRRRRKVMRDRLGITLHLPRKGKDATGRASSPWSSRPEGQERLAIPSVRIAALWALGFGVRLTALLLTGTDKGKSSMDRRIKELRDGADHLDATKAEAAIERARLKWARKATEADPEPTAPASRPAPRGETGTDVERQTDIDDFIVEKPAPTAGTPGLLGRALHGLDWGTPQSVYAELLADGVHPSEAAHAVTTAQAQKTGAAAADVERLAEALRVEAAKPVEPVSDTKPATIRVRRRGPAPSSAPDSPAPAVPDAARAGSAGTAKPKRGRGRFDPVHHFWQTWAKGQTDDGRVAYTAPSGRIRVTSNDTGRTVVETRQADERAWSVYSRHTSWETAGKAGVKLEKSIDKPRLVYPGEKGPAWDGNRRPAPAAGEQAGTAEADPLDTLSDAERARASVRLGMKPQIRDFVDNLPPRSQTFLQLLAGKGRVSITEVVEALDLAGPKSVGHITGSIGRWAPIRGLENPIANTTERGERVFVWTGFERPAGAPG